MKTQMREFAVLSRVGNDFRTVSKVEEEINATVCELISTEK